jgi:hypothetical protein
MPAVLWVLAVGSYWTFAHRMYHSWRELQPLSISDRQVPVETKSKLDREIGNPQSAIGNRQSAIQ